MSHKIANLLLVFFHWNIGIVDYGYNVLMWRALVLHRLDQCRM